MTWTKANKETTMTMGNVIEKKKTIKLLYNGKSGWKKKYKKKTTWTYWKGSLNLSDVCASFFPVPSWVTWRLMDFLTSCNHGVDLVKTRPWRPESEWICLKRNVESCCRKAIAPNLTTVFSTASLLLSRRLEVLKRPEYHHNEPYCWTRHTKKWYRRPWISDLR